MAYYIRRGNTFRVSSTDALDISDVLPAGNYMVQFDERNSEYFLETISAFELPKVLYGDVNKQAERIINTYHDRPSSTGLLLTGDKGSGKTMLAKRLSQLLCVEGIATIVINECMYGDLFNKFIQSIDQPCIILFDEFEKVYTNEKQEQILTLLDGVFPTKKLFIFTTNETRRINTHLCNRPGRIFYTIRYVGLTDVFIRQYCADVLIDQSYIEEICRASLLFESFNFDILKALVEDMNRYDESPEEALKMLNATPDAYTDYDSMLKFDVQLIVDGVTMVNEKLDNNGIWSGNPLHPNGIRIPYRNSNDKTDDDDYWVYACFKVTDLVNVDVNIGQFEFRNSDDVTIKLLKKVKQVYDYRAF